MPHMSYRVVVVAAAVSHSLRGPAVFKNSVHARVILVDDGYISGWEVKGVPAISSGKLSPK
ncbi:hypothetical protein QTP88_008691 [Uroleucon formosanum]